MTRLVLIDGSSYLYRAFHALPPLTAPDGSPTGALFGIVNMLRATLKENPDYTAFVVDASGPTFRDELYPAYKATRAAMPDDLRARLEGIEALTDGDRETIVGLARRALAGLPSRPALGLQR